MFAHIAAAHAGTLAIRLVRSHDSAHNLNETAHFEVYRHMVMDGRAPVTQWKSFMGKNKGNGKRYDQAGAVPFRVTDDGIEFCLITSRGKGKWCFPKGVIDPGETPVETALKESDEEAGVRGEIWGPPLGSYIYSKWGRSLSVIVMLLQVHETADRWDESDVRKRRWVTLDEARTLLDRAQLRDFVIKAAERLEVLVDKD